MVVMNAMWTDQGIGPQKSLATRRAMAMLLLFILPIAKDGPLTFAAMEWKFLLVFGLFLAALPEISRTVRSQTYQQSIPLLAFSVCLTVLVYLRSDEQGISTNMTLVLIINGLFLIALCRLFDASMVRHGITILAMLSLMVCAVAVLQYLVISFHLSLPLLVSMLPPEQQVGYFGVELPVGPEGIRVPSVFFHSNQLGHFLAVIFAIYFPLLLRAQKPKQAALYGLVIVAVTTCSVLSQSRGGLILIGLAAAITLLLFGTSMCRSWKSALIVTAGVTVAGCGLLALNASAFLERMATLGLSSREINWTYALQLVWEHGMFGVGRGASGHQLTVNFPPIEYISLLNNYAAEQDLNVWANNPHNYYLATIVEAGVFVLVAEILLFGLLIRHGYKLFVGSGSSVIRALAVGAISVLIIEFVRGVFESYVFLGAPETGAIVAFVCGLVLYLGRRSEENQCCADGLSQSQI